MDNSDKKEFARQMMIISEIYDKPVSTEKLQIYFSTLSKYTIKQVVIGIEKHMQDVESGQYFPKPANIIKHIEGEKSNINDMAEIAWLEVENAIRMIGAHGRLKLRDKIAIAAVKSIGSWSDLCMTNIDKMQWKKKEFIDSYELLSKTPVEMLPDSLPGIADIKNSRMESKQSLKALHDGIKKIQNETKPLPGESKS